MSALFLHILYDVLQHKSSLDINTDKVVQEIIFILSEVFSL